MKKIVLFAAVLLFSAAHAQQTCYQNPSVEGPSAPHVVPAPWQACYGSPDTQPGQWGITLPPSNGTGYVSFLHSGNSVNGYSEGMTQLLVPAMVANTTYSFTVDLAYSPIYNTASPGNCYSSLQIWGGNSACAQTELLWQSGPFTHPNWQTYNVTFTPTGNWTYIAFEPYYITPCTGYINCLLDNISCIAPVNGNVTGTAALCANTCDGTVTANPSSGTPPYTYLWTPGNYTTQTVTGLCAGTYSCVITDANSQTVTGSFTVTAPPPVALTATSTNILCFGQCTGTASANGSGGTGTLGYSWSNSSTTQSLTGLCQGTYTVTMTDANGCSITSSVTITEPPLLTSSATFTDVTCFGAANGTASVTASGGTSGYTYSWSPSGGNQSTASNLGPNTYTVTVTDANGCTSTSTVTIIQPTQLITTSNGSSVPCAGSCTGIGTTSASGGTGNLTYSWSPGNMTTTNPTGLCAGTYTVTVTDANGCTSTDTIQVVQPPAILLSTTVQDASCNESNGNATVTATNGNAPYSYSWSPSGGTAATGTGLGAGTYTVTVTDATGCTSTATATVIDNSPTATISPTIVIMAGNNTALTSTGGGVYSWSPTNNLSCTDCPNPTANPTVTTQYCVTITDQNGCTDSQCTYVIVEYPCPIDENFGAPNAFSPNKDGKNDIFLVQGMGLCFKDFVLTVYDRWGEKVFETTNPNTGWDGTYKGKPLDPGVYVYYISTTLVGTSTAIEKRGNVTLMR
ncbi:MAG: gliding motility-associated C-terminal domain-containing protein [Bacteroidia bacterium]|nr:gliding motility-associated C-terminal domain-containing protein [Bacteroidia bacterium]